MKFSVGNRVSICACSAHSYKVSLLDCTALETKAPRAGNLLWYFRVVVGKQVFVPGWSKIVPNVLWLAVSGGPQ